MTATRSLLSVEDLSVTFQTEQGPIAAVQNVGFELQPATTLGVIGETGSGKTMMVRALTRLALGAEISGKVWLQGENLLALPEKRLRNVRGRQIAMVFQNPLGGLNPVMRVGAQIAEPLRHHLRISKSDAWQRAVGLLRDVGIPDPDRCLSEYPIQLSGGMQQRVMIAIALSCDPDILIADEPTTALDVTVQTQILDLLQRLREEHDMALILVSHDLAVVSERADNVVVMYAGRVVESGPTQAVIEKPRFPYTAGLIDATPGLASEDSLPEQIRGAPPDPTERLLPCPFVSRCSRSLEVCLINRPPVDGDYGGHEWRCWNPMPPAGGASNVD